MSIGFADPLVAVWSTVPCVGDFFNPQTWKCGAKYVGVSDAFDYTIRPSVLNVNINGKGLFNLFTIITRNIILLFNQFAASNSLRDSNSFVSNSFEKEDSDEVDIMYNTDVQDDDMNYSDHHMKPVSSQLTNYRNSKILNHYIHVNNVYIVKIADSKFLNSMQM
jgi:hypothetical protein